jgi:hypothetical protein
LRSIVGGTRRNGMRNEILKTEVAVQNLLTDSEDK